MELQLVSLKPVLPEIVLMTAACVVLVVDVFLQAKHRLLTYGLALGSLIATLAALGASGVGEAGVILDGAFVSDALSQVLKAALLIVSLLALVYAKDYLVNRAIYRGEFFVLALFALLGMMVMISANNFLTVYLGLELQALWLYALVAFNRDSRPAPRRR